MKKQNKILSLVVALLMLVAASITVNKAIFGHDFTPGAAAVSAEPAVTAASGETVIHTAGLPGTIDGYAGPVALDIRIADGRIAEIRPLPNAESPAFFKRATAVIESWIGKTPDEALGVKVDAISGATYSSNAIIANVRAGLADYQQAALSPASATPWKTWVALAVTLAACILPLFVSNRKYHFVQMVANVAVLGFWCGQFLDYQLILKYISGGFTLPAGLVAIAMLVAAFIYPLFGRTQHYCNHICPLGSAQLLVAQVSSYKLKISTPVLRALDWFRKLLWAALMLLLWTDCLTGWMDLELFQAFQFESASWWIIGAAALFVGLSAVVSRPYCRFVCPTGSLFKRAENIG